MAGALSHTLVLEAPAKVNVSLAVHYPPRKGYHVLESVFQALDVHDVVTFRICESDELPDALVTSSGTPVALSCPGIDVAPDKNLAYRALDAVECACGLRAVPRGFALDITIEKHIPAGGGLGGGSSDAAAVLRAYALLHGYSATYALFTDVARQLGADVAFFLYGGAALMGGRGDVFERRISTFPLPFVLMGDASALSTPDVYAVFDAAHEDASAVPDDAVLPSALVRELDSPDATARSIAALCANNLDAAACSLAPQLAERLARARADEDVLAALVSGSGATCFAICADDERAHAFAERASDYCAWVRVAHARLPYS